MANVDHRIRVVEANDDFVRQFGRPAADLSGRMFGDLLHASVRDLITQQLLCLVQGVQTRFSTRMIAQRPRDGATFGGMLTAVAVYGPSGRSELVTVLVRPDPDEDESILSVRRRILTVMDAKILEGVAAGVSTVQLAAMLYLSRGGVEYHVTTLLRKLKVNNRPALISKAYSMGLLNVGSWPPRVLPEYVK